MGVRNVFEWIHTMHGKMLGLPGGTPRVAAGQGVQLTRTGPQHYKED